MSYYDLHGSYWRIVDPDMTYTVDLALETMQEFIRRIVVAGN